MRSRAPVWIILCLWRFLRHCCRLNFQTQRGANSNWALHLAFSGGLKTTRCWEKVNLDMYVHLVSGVDDDGEMSLL